jgi:hypothetical protein
MHNQQKLVSSPKTGISRYLIPIASTILIASAGGYVYQHVGQAATTTGAVFLESAVDTQCLDDNHSGTANGNEVDTDGCNQTAAQQWELNSNGTIENPNGKCLDNPYGRDLNNNKITIYTCSANNKAEQWKNAGNTLKNPATNKCIDDPYASDVDGTQLILYTCNGKKQQIWKAVAQ